MIGRLITSVFNIFPRNGIQNKSCSPLAITSAILNQPNLILNRNKMRYHFPHPSEFARIKKHGWVTRMSTPNGRKILMRRILKGKHVLSH